MAAHLDNSRQYSQFLISVRYHWNFFLYSQTEQFQNWNQLTKSNLRVTFTFSFGPSLLQTARHPDNMNIGHDCPRARVRIEKPMGRLPFSP